jgi:hypothetical protein
MAQRRFAVFMARTMTGSCLQVKVLLPHSPDQVMRRNRCECMNAA